MKAATKDLLPLCEAGHHAGIAVELDDGVSGKTWLDGEPLAFGFILRLRAGFDQQAISNVIVLVDNQTVGMMRLDMTLQVSLFGAAIDVPAAGNVCTELAQAYRTSHSV